MTNTVAPRTHFTAWLVNDASCLDQGCMDISILEDLLLTNDGDDDGDWATDAGKPAAFYAVTTVDAKDGDIDDAITEARHLMENAGWRIVGDWDATPNAYTVTVERA
jgi:hypothetical protein